MPKPFIDMQSSILSYMAWLPVFAKLSVFILLVLGFSILISHQNNNEFPSILPSLRPATTGLVTLPAAAETDNVDFVNKRNPGPTVAPVLPSPFKGLHAEAGENASNYHSTNGPNASISVPGAVHVINGSLSSTFHVVTGPNASLTINTRGGGLGPPLSHNTTGTNPTTFHYTSGIFASQNVSGQPPVVSHYVTGTNQSWYHIVTGPNASANVNDLTTDAAHITSPSTDATKLHVTSGTNASLIGGRTTGGVPGFHITTGTDATTFTGPGHVFAGPEATRFVGGGFFHVTMLGSGDYTRYFPPGWVHNNIPGPHQTYYFPPGSSHMSFSTIMTPGGGPHITTGPDASDNAPNGGVHIDDPGPQETQYLVGDGFGNGYHINAGPDETTWVPNGHEDTGANATVYHPPNWLHNTQGPDTTSWHPPGWEHKNLGADNSNYLPIDYFHANLHATNGGAFGGSEDHFTQYLPPGWFHVSNSNFVDHTSYMPPGTVHFSLGGGTWPHPDVGLEHSGRLSIINSTYIGPTLSHFNTGADLSLVGPSNPSGYVHEITSSHNVPSDWAHVIIANPAQGLVPTAMIEPTFQHNTNPNNGYDTQYIHI